MEITKEIKLYIEQSFFSTGRPPSATEIQTHFNWSKDQLFSRLEAINKYQTENNLHQPISSLLPAEQFQLVQMLLNTADRRSVRMKLKQCGITPSEYDKMRNTPVFQNFFRTQVERRFKNAGATADLELLKILEDGDLRGIQYYNEITGRYRTTESLNVQQVLALVMEILVTLVTPDILKKIANELEEKIVRGALQIDQGNGVIEVGSGEWESSTESPPVVYSDRQSPRLELNL